MAKDEQVLIKLSESEKIGFKKAAEISGIGFSAWARQVLRIAATKELQGAGEKVPFLEVLSIDGDKSPEEASELFHKIMKKSVMGNPKPKEKKLK